MCKKKKKNVSFMMTIVICCLFMVLFKGINISASTKENLEQKLQEQSDDLRQEMEGVFENEETDWLESMTDSILNTKYEGVSNIPQLTNKLQQLLRNFLIETRTATIIIYGLLVLCILIYMATVGSKSLTKRRRGMLWLYGFTGLFLVYINIPLLMLYFEADRSGLESISMYTRILNIIEMLRKNSIIISSLIAYVGTTLLIISRNDLPKRMQGLYLIKFSVILLIFLNITPIAINFIL